MGCVQLSLCLWCIVWMAEHFGSRASKHHLILFPKQTWFPTLKFFRDLMVEDMWLVLGSRADAKPDESCMLIFCTVIVIWHVAAHLLTKNTMSKIKLNHVCASDMFCSRSECIYVAAWRHMFLAPCYTAEEWLCNRRREGQWIQICMTFYTRFCPSVLMHS